VAEQGADGGKVLEAPLVAIGAVLIAAAIVGGAVEGAGVKVPVIAGTGRQVVAGLAGLVMLVVGLSSRWLPVARGGMRAVRDWSERRVARRVPRPDVGVAPPASEHFVGREAELRWLRQELARSRRIVLSGLGGVGKTQLALRYLLRHRSRYRRGTFWLRGEEPAVFDGDLASLAEFLELPQRGQPDQEVVIAGVVRWLARHDRWLLVIDNLDGEAVELVDRRLPSELPGHLLITSRHPLPGSHLALEPLPLEAATDVLLRRVPHPDVAMAREVAARLDCLPLALEQASAYLEQTGEELATYAELLETNLARLLDEGKVANHPGSVVTTWDLSLQRIEERSAASADLLRLCAFLSPEAIPLSLLEQAAGALPAESGLAAVIGDRVGLNQLISVLLDYSLLSREGDRLTLQRLVQVVVRDSLSEADPQPWASTAVRMLAAAFPTESEEPARWAECQELLPHALAAAEHAIQDAVEPVDTSSLLDRAATYERSRAEFSAARPLFERALAIAERVQGPNHPNTGASLNNLAILLQVQGKLADARPLFERALAIHEAAYGPDHPEVATDLNNLADLLQAQGELAAARPLLNRALAIRERVLGPDHPDTAISLNNLASLLQAQGKLADARPFFERALTIFERVLGPDHPETGTSLNNLARLLRDQGQLADARPLFERALAVRERVLGPDHPHTAISLDDLAGLLQAQGKLADARPLFERALAIRERVLGPDHPATATNLNNLARLLQEQGKRAAARPLFERALAIHEAAYGRDHPEVATDLNNLACLLQDQGKRAAARPLFERALAIEERVLGPDHPRTAQGLNNLASLLQAQGELADARPLFERALAICERALGPDHPTTVLIRGNLERLRGKRK
jgi:tetratricopeptide (TPR) repeat protein